jgi:Thrombospondin type 3 repeat
MFLFPKILSLIFALGLSFGLQSVGYASPIFAQEDYDTYSDISLPKPIELPTIFEIPAGPFSPSHKQKIQVANSKNEPAQLFGNTIIVSQPDPTFKLIPISPTKEYINFLYDQNNDSYTEFDLDKDKGEASFGIEFQEPVEFEGLNLVLSQGTTLPQKVEILGQNATEKFTILAKSDLSSTGISTPKVKVTSIAINLTHSQILRISEILPRLASSNKPTVNKLYFLAKPNENYKYYTSKSEEIFANFKQLPTDINYRIETSKLSAPVINPAFEIKDTDKDGIVDIKDNCLKVANPDQSDKDNNKVGDSCEDRDLDGVIDNNDNCPLIANPTQLNLDSDEFGDNCDKEDNRIFENNKWIVPSVVGVATLLIIGVFVLRLKKMD